MPLTRSNPHRPPARLRKVIQRHKRAAYQEAIVEAAASLFVRVGFGTAKMSEIAAEAGVSVGTLYNYFASKDAVISALVRHEYAQFMSSIAAVEETRDPLERIRATIQRSLHFVEQRGALLAMAVQAGLVQEHQLEKHLAAECCEPGIQDPRAHVLRLYEQALTEAMQAGSIRPDLSPRKLSLALDGMTTALVMDWVREGQSQPLLPQSEFVFALFSRGVVPR